MNKNPSDLKAAVRSFTRTFAVDLLDKKIRVNAVSPGPTFTPIFERLGLPDDQLKNVADQIMSSIPLKRFGTTEDIANAVLFLGCSDSAFMTGAEIVIEDGNTNALAKQQIEYTDFPFENFMFYAVWAGEFWVLMLRSEY